MKKQPVPLFVLGSGRSGTTITASLLNRLPRIHVAKETGFIGQNIDLLRDIQNLKSRSRLIEVVNSWLSIEQWETRASSEGFEKFCDQFDVGGPVAFLHYVWQLESSLPWDQLEYIGDNTPLYVTSIPAILDLFPNAKFIHVVRDPRDVVCSVTRMRFGADDLVSAALEWHQTIGCWMMAERMIASENRIECLYERLCVDAQSAMRELATFLGRLESEADQALAEHLNAASEGALFNKVSGLSHHSRLNAPLSPQQIGRYRTELTDEQIIRIEEILQYGMRAYGYQPGKWHIGPFVTENRMAILRAGIRDFLKRCRRRMGMRKEK